MRIQKKIVKSFIALLPLLGLLLMFVTSFNSKSETYPYHSIIRFSDSTSSLVFENPDAINSKMIGSMYSDSYNLHESAPTRVTVSGSMLILARFAYTIGNITGVPLTYTLIPLWYAFYLFVIEILFMAIEIIAFVPRKCGEFFGG